MARVAASQIAADRGALPDGVASRDDRVAAPGRHDRDRRRSAVRAIRCTSSCSTAAERGLDQFADDAHDSGSARDLSLGIAVHGRLPRRAGVPDGVFAVSIGGRWDPVVPARRHRISTARQHITSTVGGLGAHGKLPGAPAVTTQVALAIRGRVADVRGPRRRRRPTTSRPTSSATDRGLSPALAL